MKAYQLYLLSLFLSFSLLTSTVTPALAQGWAWGRGSAGAQGIDGWPVAADGSGNVYVGGFVQGGGGSPSFGGITIPGYSAIYQSVWAKYDASGTLLWADGTKSGSTYLNNITTDPSGNLILFGIFYSSTMQIGSITLTNTKAPTAQYFLAKVSPSGTVLWAINDGMVMTWPPFGLSFTPAIFTPFSAAGVTTDAAGNIYITGSFGEKSMTIGTFTLKNADPAFSYTYDVYVAKYSPSGSVVWASSIGGTDQDYAFGITVSSGGSVYISGCFNSPSISVGSSVITNPFPKPRAYIAKFSSAGAPLWADAAGGANGAYAIALTSDNFGNVYMTGGFGDTSISFGTTTITRAFPGSVPYLAQFIVQYTSADVVTWNKSISAMSRYVIGYSIALASCGEVWVSGSFTAPAQLDTGHIVSPPFGGDPAFIAGYNIGGGIIGSALLRSGGDDQVNVACDPSGNVFVCSDYEMGGMIFGTDTLPDATPASEFLYVGKFNNLITGTDTTYAVKDTNACYKGKVFSMTLTATTGFTSYIWDDLSTSPTRTITTSGTYYVFCRNGCDKSMEIDSFYVTVAPTDTINTAMDTTACSGKGVIKLNGPPAAKSYLWSTGSTATSINILSPGTYYVSALSACSEVNDTFHVSIHKSPVVDLGNDTAFCAGNTLLLSSVQPAGYTYLWNTGSTASSITASITGTYWLAVDDSSCVTTDTIHVLISPHPVVDLGPDYFNCFGVPDTLQSRVTYVAPAYLWSNAAITPSIAATSTGKYWLQVTVAGCAGADTMNVTILGDTLMLYNHDTAICKGDTVFARATGGPGQIYQWLPTAGVAVSTSSSTMITPDTSATYVLRSLMEGCPEVTDSFHIDVEPTPAIALPVQGAVCQFDQLHINASVSPRWYADYTYHWSPGTSLDNSNTASVVFRPGVSTNLVLKVSTRAGCKTSDSIQVVVHPGNFAAMDTSIDLCPHDSVQLLPKGGIAYSWHPTLYLTDSTSSKPWVKPVTSMSYSAIAYSEYGCKDTITARITVHPSGEIYMPDSATIHPGESYQISPQTNCVSFSWFPSEGLDDILISNPRAMPDVNTRYIVTATTEWNCKIVDSIYIVTDGTELALPNAFTPGGSVNSVFKIIKKGTATLTFFRIFNRWGNLVFETANIDEGWDGTYNGVPQPFDVYVYQVAATTNSGVPFNKHGNVTLIR